mmetsp:Transcript_15113/g.40586  ORF Transcript_15113/g.40586 Transcript_15113/m.40586 type:complete len:118 (+) Transcript_15113:302-655(+)
MREHMSVVHSIPVRSSAATLETQLQHDTMLQKPPTLECRKEAGGCRTPPHVASQQGLPVSPPRAPPFSEARAARHHGSHQAHLDVCSTHEARRRDTRRSVRRVRPRLALPARLTWQT